VAVRVTIAAERSPLPFPSMSARAPCFLEASLAGLRIAHRADLDPGLVVRAVRRHIANTRTARATLEQRLIRSCSVMQACSSSMR